MNKKRLLFMLTFLMFLMILSGIYYVLVRNVKLKDAELYEITSVINGYDYKYLLNEEFDDVRDINIMNVLNNRSFYENEPVVEETYLVSADKVSLYLKKYTGLSISEFNNPITDELDMTNNMFTHVFYDTETYYRFDCLKGTYRKNRYNLTCARDGKLYNVVLNKSKNVYKVVSFVSSSK